MSSSRPAASRLGPGLPAMVATVLFLIAPLAQATEYGPIEVVVQPPPAVEGTTVPEMHAGGYIEHRIEVRNHSETADYLVRLVFPAEPYSSYGDYLERDSRTIKVARGSTSVVCLFQPSLLASDDAMAVEINGMRQKALIGVAGSGARSTFSYAMGGSSPPALFVLASRDIPQELKDGVRAAHSDQVVFCRSELATSAWSPNWLGYTGFDAVLLTDQEAASLPADVLLALRRYVEAGGMILAQPSSAELAEGKLDPKTIVPDTLRDPDSQLDDDGAFHVGFGLVRPCPQTTPWPGEFWVAPSKDPVAPGDPDVQVEGMVGVPVRGLLLLMICFAIGIGPVNVWLLSRRKRRMWLWWNVPAVSLGTCLAVFGYALLSEGISGRGQMALITLLDENTHRATTLGYASYYCPLTPSDGLHFSYDTEVAPLRKPGGYRAALFFGGGRPKTVDWTSDQHLDSGWIAARVPACFAVRKSETRRERLTVHRGADGALKVVNGLGMPIESLYYADENGDISVADDLPPGEERTLARSDKVIAATPPSSDIPVDVYVNTVPTQGAPATEGNPPGAVGGVEAENESLVADGADPANPDPADPEDSEDVAISGETIVKDEETSSVPPLLVGGVGATSSGLRILFDQPWATSLHELQSHPEKYLRPGCYVAVIRQRTFLEDPLVAAPQQGSFGIVYGIGARGANGR